MDQNNTHNQNPFNDFSDDELGQKLDDLFSSFMKSSDGDGELEAESDSKEQWIEQASNEFEQMNEDNQQSEEFKMELDYLEDEKQEDQLWMARTGLNEEGLCGAIETIIFMSDRPISLQKIKALIDEDMPLRVLHQAIERLQTEYESKHHGIRLVEVAQGHQFRTKATYSRFVQDLFRVSSLVLTPSALEVLAIIAYKQPISKSDIDKIRGVDSSHLVRGLMDRRLVKITGRSEDLGRPTLYGTTTEFLEVFNLSSIADLPSEEDLNDLLGKNEIGKISDIKNIIVHKDKKSFYFDEMDELESLSQSIKSISTDTEFTKGLREENRLAPVMPHAQDGQTPVELQRLPIRSAFDIMEDFIKKQQVVSQNQLAVQSQPILAVISAQSIGDLSAGPFNVPTPDEDEDEEDWEIDDFKMIDLNTGLPLEDEQTPTTSNAMDQFFNQGGQELGELRKAQGLLTAQCDDFDQFDIDHLEEQILHKTDQAIEKAKELDIDLNFIMDSPAMDKGQNDYPEV